jgi:quercetin dioxygenase-like cupin family protein
MRKIEIVTPDEMPMGKGYAAPRCRVTGSVRSRTASPGGASIWMLAAEFDAGSSLSWEARHGDEALFVQQGELSVDGRSCPEGGAVVIEANALPTITAPAPTRLLHMGPRDDAPPEGGLYGPPQPAGGGVHVVGPRGTFEELDDQRETRFFADATCPSCRLWLLYTARNFAFDSQVHSHSQDELIYVLHGEIQLGSLRLLPGSSVFIAANQLYSFRAGEQGFGFINYRRDASEMTTRSTGKKLLEAGAATGLIPVNDLR